MWVSGTRVFAQRDTNAAEPIADVGADATFANVHHGGRLVDVFDRNFNVQSVELTAGTWQQTSAPDAAPDGGTFRSGIGLSHDADTAVSIRDHPVPGSITTTLRLFDAYGHSDTSVVQISTALAQASSICVDSLPEYLFPLYDQLGNLVEVDTVYLAQCANTQGVGMSERVAWDKVAFEPGRARALVSVTIAATVATASGQTACPNAFTLPDGGPSALCRSISSTTSTERTDVFEVDLETRTHPKIWPVSGAQVFWLGASEDGGEVTLGEGSVSQSSAYAPDPNAYGVFLNTVQPQVTTGCAVTYRSLSAGVLRKSIPSVDVCRNPANQGTIAPAPRRLGGP